MLRITPGGSSLFKSKPIQCFHHYLPFTFYSQGDAGRHGGHQQDGRQVPERHHVQLQEETGVDTTTEVEEVGAILSKAAKKKVKKQHQKNRRCPLQQV